MKKLAVGCLVLVLVGLVLLGAAAYFGYRAARPMIDSASNYLERAKEVAAVGDRIENKASFDAPASGELTDGQVQRFVNVHEQVRKTLGPRWTELETKANALRAKARESSRELSFSEVASVFSDLSGVFMDARRAHVDALNAARFSSSEYSWVRLRMYEAAGLELAGGIDLSAAEAFIRKGATDAGIEVPKVSMPAVSIPEKNRTLVKPHADKLKEWLPLAFLGM